MFRHQAQPCYPEPSQPDACFPDNTRTPSPFSCFIAGVLDRVGPEDPAARAANRSAPVPSQARPLQRDAVAAARHRSSPYDRTSPVAGSMASW